MSLSQDIAGIVLYIGLKLTCLAKGTCIVLLQVRLLSEEKLKRQQCRKYKNMQAKVFKYWEEFRAGERNSRQLLHACSHLNGPTM